MKVAVYYFPNYHADARNEAFHGKGWTEWELMQCARPRFDGHDQPKIPLWGCEDEANPMVMAKKIDTAAGYGIDVFVFDWYWYDGPYLERCLNEAFLQASNREKLKFALMWANHTWRDIHPCNRAKSQNPDALYKWNSTRENIGEVWDYIIEKYLTQPNYWQVGGLPYFSIYAVNDFITRMGGAEATFEVLEILREKARRVGLAGVHIGAILINNLDKKHCCGTCSPQDWVQKAGFSSYSHYNGMVLHFAELGFPIADFERNLREYLDSVAKIVYEYPAVYYPCVTTGWDSSPRTIQSETYDLRAYPFMPILEHKPEKFAKSLFETAQMLKNRLPEEQILFINAWNEWTEGSYLEPDKKDGYAFLQAVKNLKNNCL